ncbi:MAG: terminase [Flavobacteriales bacterium]|nr:terminase [Flavobacteriales bacterium]
METLDQILGIAENAVTTTQPTTPAIPRPQTTDEDEDDFKYSRENLYHIIERGQDALEGVLKVAQETDHPRAYEVAGQLLKTNADNAEKLVNLQTTKKKVREESGPKNVTNALFVGSTTELQKLIKGK